ncbi:MAG: hypothetical protein M1308_03540 [Actinobacteria bacterium]|nr:hypothetical protein [Actinomycetota bacterium]
MKKLNWQILLGLILALLSAALYLVHYFIFRDVHHIFLYLIGDIAFLPIEVLFVTLIIDRVLSVREKKTMLEKLNMVIGAFFSEVGLKLIYLFEEFDLNVAAIKRDLAGIDKWKDKDFLRQSGKMDKYKCNINSKQGDLEILKAFLSQKRTFLLRLLENPNLLEHESFTALLWAVFHLTEELEYRNSFNYLPDSDYNHLSIDIKRAYLLIIKEYLAYIKHLKTNYPYLFSLASRTNPFNDEASPIVNN